MAAREPAPTGPSSGPPAVLQVIGGVLAGLLLGSWTVLCWIAWVLAPLLGGRSAARLRPRIMRRWARTGLGLFRAEVHVEGVPPSAPFLLVTNHLSYLDVLVIAAVAPARFLSRADVADWPGIGLIARSAGTLFIDRAAKRDLPKVIAQVEQAFEAGHGLIFFPEGTSSGGADVLPFKASLFEFAARSRTPVHCASLAYERPAHRPPAAETVCWWADMTFGDHAFGLLARPGFTARLAFAPSPVVADDRKQLAAAAQAAVEQLFVATDAARLRDGAVAPGHDGHTGGVAPPAEGPSA